MTHPSTLHPATLHPPTLHPPQTEIRVSVDGNVVRFGHQPHPDREQKDEEEQVGRGRGEMGRGCEAEQGRVRGRHSPHLTDHPPTHPLLLLQGIFHRAERVSSFRGRALRLPDNADMEVISAKCERGWCAAAAGIWWLVDCGSCARSLAHPGACLPLRL